VTRSRTLVAGLLAASAVLLGGCGGEGGEPTASDSTVSTVARAPTTVEITAPLVSECDTLRSELQDAKADRIEAGFDSPTDDAARARIDTAARSARQAGCDIDDLVGPGVGR
jgi:hypothetical protein